TPKSASGSWTSMKGLRSGGTATRGWSNGRLAAGGGPADRAARSTCGARSATTSSRISGRFAAACERTAIAGRTPLFAGGHQRDLHVVVRVQVAGRLTDGLVGQGGEAR